MARTEYTEVYTLAIRYGQRHEHELLAAEHIASALGSSRHIVLDVDLRAWGGSSLTSDAPVPKDRCVDGEEIPSTYVPARNIIFLSLAAAWAEILGAEAIVIGANALDYSGYPDCRPAFIEAYQQMLNKGTKSGLEGKGVRIEAPLIHLSKAEIIREGISRGLDYSLTHSCYDPAPDGGACGCCDSCLLRKKGFAEAGIPDPTRYTTVP
jgi:7-cyano-7-deazaguanine synthase